MDFACFTRLALWGWEMGLFIIKPIDLIPYLKAFCEGHGGKWNEDEFLAGIIAGAQTPDIEPDQDVVFW